MAEIKNIKMAEEKLIIPPPTIQDRQVVKPLLCGPGPCDLWPSVIEALSQPVVTPMCDEHFYIMDDIRAGLQYLFQTRSKLVLAMSGSGHSGMEAIIGNLLAPKETLLIASRGIWDERALNMARRYGLKPIVTKVPLNETFSLKLLEPLLKRTRPKALFITHGDSSTGTVQNLEGLGELCHKYGTLLLVDTVVSLGAVPFLMDEWEIDAVYSSSQKALSGPAGISPVAFSARAEQVINNRKHEPPFYFDIKLLAQQWNCYGNTRAFLFHRKTVADEYTAHLVVNRYYRRWKSAMHANISLECHTLFITPPEALPAFGDLGMDLEKGYHHTMSPPLMWALRCCLQETTKETLPKAWARHAATTAHFHTRLEQLSFKFLVPKPEDRLATVTTVVLPKGYDYKEFSKYMRAKHNILIFAGLGPTVGKALRIGLMGVNSTIEVADAVAGAMADTMRALTKASL